VTDIAGGAKYGYALIFGDRHLEAVGDFPADTVVTSWNCHRTCSAGAVLAARKVTVNHNQKDLRALLTIPIAIYCFTAVIGEPLQQFTVERFAVHHRVSSTRYILRPVSTPLWREDARNNDEVPDERFRPAA
jgi:hypothetical protein